MYKLLVLSALCALTAATPSQVDLIPSGPLPLIKSSLLAEPTHVEIHEPVLTKVGDIIENVPTAVSHQSSTIVHSRAQQVSPIVAPSVRSYAAPLVRSYAAVPASARVSAVPLVAQTLPYLRTLGPAEAFVRAHANALPLQLRAYTYGSYGGPLIYAAPVLKN